MNDNNINDEIYHTAFHESAHAVMCIMKGSAVFEVVVNEEADERSRLGYCSYSMTKDHMDGVWILLAGPAATSLFKKIELREAFVQGGSSDFEKARASFGDLIFPSVPAELRQYIGTDVKTYMSLWCDGWVPEGISGQMKRKLTLFTKKCLKADEFVCDWVHREAERVRDWLTTTPGMLDSVRYLADHLAKVRRMESKEIIDLMWPYYQAQQESGKLAA